MMITISRTAGPLIVNVRIIMKIPAQYLLVIILLSGCTTNSRDEQKDATLTVEVILHEHDLFASISGVPVTLAQLKYIMHHAVDEHPDSSLVFNIPTSAYEERVAMLLKMARDAGYRHVVINYDSTPYTPANRDNGTHVRHEMHPNQSMEATRDTRASDFEQD